MAGGEVTLAPQRRSVIFEVGVRLVFHTMLVFSLFLLFSGHNAPGGGFTGGLVAGVALIVRYLAGGRFELAAATPSTRATSSAAACSWPPAPGWSRCSSAGRSCRARWWT